VFAIGSRVRVACLLVLFLAACGGSANSDSPLAHRVQHLEEQGFDAEEMTPPATPCPWRWRLSG